MITDEVETFWDINQHRLMLKPVIEWQKQNGIASYRIYVGEFGVWRKAAGAEQYLKDLVQIFNEQGWSWSYYSFREEPWDNTDLEKTGTDPKRSQTDLFKAVQQHFR